MNDLILKKRTTSSNKQYIFLIVLMGILTIGTSIGYSYVQKDMKVSGNLKVSKFTGKKVSILGTTQEAFLDNGPSDYVTSLTGIDFKQTSSNTNGKGLYIKSGTENNTYPIYYYRGAVENNNVIFAEKCWKIVRTTEKGGTKLLYSGIPYYEKCTNDSSPISTSYNILYNTDSNYYQDEHRYVGYVYERKNVNTDSYLKKKIDDWYATYMASYTSKLEDAVYCNDRSNAYTYSSNQIIYGGYKRHIYSKTPSFDCEQNSDRFTVSTANGNGLLTYPVATITADEVAYAGGVYYKGSDYYLNTGSAYWTMTPSGSGDSEGGEKIGNGYKTSIFYVSGSYSVMSGIDGTYNFFGGATGSSNSENKGSLSIYTCNYWFNQQVNPNRRVPGVPSGSRCDGPTQGPDPNANTGAYGDEGWDSYTRSASARPMITLKVGTVISSGTGTKTDPYVVN